MKKSVIIVLFIVSMFLIAGCKEGAVGGNIGSKKVYSNPAAGLVNYGDLVVSSNVLGADLYIDGSYHSTLTPYAGQLDSTSFVIKGSMFNTAVHVIKIRKDGYEPYERTVTLRPRQSTFVNAELNAVAPRQVTPVDKDEYLLRSEGSGEYVIVGGYRVSVAKVGSGGDVAVNVDGTTKILSDGQTAIIFGLQITNLDQFYDTNSQLQSSANLLILIMPAKHSESVEVTGSITEDVPIGVNIASPNQFNSVLTKSDLESLFTGQITFGGKSYKTSEKLILDQQKNVSLQTSLTSSDDDYKSDVRLEFEKSSMIYLYSFDDIIPMGEISRENPLEINFLGHNLKIVRWTSFTRILACIDKENCTEQELVSIQDGGKYFGGDDTCSNDDSKDPDCWKWVVKSINSTGKTVFTDTTTNGIYWTPSFSGGGPVLALQNNFALNDYKDNPLKPGECASFPNDYLSVCFDSLSTNDADNLNLTFQKDTGFDVKARQAGVIRPAGDVALLISSSVPNSLAIDTSSKYFQGKKTVNNTRTSKIWLGSMNESNVNVYYEDSNGITQLAGMIRNNATFAYIDYGRIKGTSGTSVTLNAKMNYNNLELEIEPADYDLSPHSDTLWMNWKYMSTGSLNGLGYMMSSEEADELKWEGARIGTKDEDHRTKFGIIIKNPKGGGSFDRITLEIPNDFMQGNIIIKK